MNEHDEQQGNSMGGIVFGIAICCLLYALAYVVFAGGPPASMGG